MFVTLQSLATACSSIHNTIDGILMHLMQAHYRALSFLWSFASMCSSIGRCLLTGRNHINIHACSVNHCCCDKLFKSSSSCSFDTLSVSPHRSCANLTIILAIVAAAATRLAFYFRRAAPCLLLDSGRRTNTPACSTGTPHGLQLLVRTRFAEKLSSSVSCIIVLRRRRVRVESLCFSLSVRTRRNRMLIILLLTRMWRRRIKLRA